MTPTTPLHELYAAVRRLAAGWAEHGPEDQRAAWGALRVVREGFAALEGAVAFLSKPEGAASRFRVTRLPSGRWHVSSGAQPGPQHVTPEGAWCRWILRNFPFKLRHAQASLALPMARLEAANGR